MTNEQLTIPIDRDSKSWAVFDESNNVIFGFRAYEDETLALADDDHNQFFGCVREDLTVIT